MPDVLRRKLSLFDAMFFVAAMATGLWVNRNTWYVSRHLLSLLA